MKTYLLRSIPEDLWRDFKSLCAWQGRTIHETLLGLIRDYVREAKGQIGSTGEYDDPLDDEGAE